MSNLVRSGIRRLAVLTALAGAAPALAQSPATPAKGDRSVAATGQTMPRAGGQPPGAALPRPASEAEMIKAQKAAEARSKAWDARMRRTMSSICHGC